MKNVDVGIQNTFFILYCSKTGTITLFWLYLLPNCPNWFFPIANALWSDVTNTTWSSPQSKDTISLFINLYHNIITEFYYHCLNMEFYPNPSNTFLYYFCLYIYPISLDCFYSMKSLCVWFHSLNCLLWGSEK